jgi:CheY-like chemotaxis protein
MGGQTMSLDQIASSGNNTKRSPQILVVDDYDGWRVVLEEYLRFMFGCRCEAVSSIVEATTLLHEMKFDLIISEYEFDSEGSCGDDLIRELQDLVSATPIIFYTNTDVRERDLASLGHDCKTIRKPDSGRLERSIASILNIPPREIGRGRDNYRLH